MSKRAKSILTKGFTEEIVLEVIGFTNYEKYPFYKEHIEYEDLKSTIANSDILPIDEIWLIGTDSKLDELEDIKKWITNNALEISFKYVYCKDMDDIFTTKQMRIMRNMIYQTVYHNRPINKDDKPLYLCLAGGRKTMSSDIQQAGYLFGCDAMFHVLARENPRFPLNEKISDYSKEDINKIYPALYQSKIVPGKAMQTINHAKLCDYNKELWNEEIIDLSGVKTDFLVKLEEELNLVDNIALNAYLKLSQANKSGYFHSLLQLDQSLINRLKSTYINDYNDGETLKSFIKSMPKTDLHCHLGGFANIGEVIEIAVANEQKIEQLIRSNPSYKDLIDKTTQAISNNHLSYLTNKLKSLKKINEEYGNGDSIPATGMIREFHNKKDLLEKVVYAEFIEPDKFMGIGLGKYERIGDIQGSTLLKNEESIRALCKVIIRNAKEHNILYQEIRCSPINYETDKMNGIRVLEILFDELVTKNASNTQFKLIIIGSRHRKENILEKHISLMEKIYKKYDRLRDFVVGFDLAGSEDTMEIQKLRDLIEPLLLKCLKITIHAGETTSAESIWKAVYYLNTDRIGHGLRLSENPDLSNKLLERKTVIELCPSSNFQVIGFNDFNLGQTNKTDYPLKQLLNEGMRVTINTDDPGISRTDITKEYFKAASMSKGGISLWDILVIARNGFKGAFLSLNEKHQIILNAEEQINKLIKDLL